MTRSILIVVALTVLTVFPLEAQAGKRIGILLFSDEARYHDALQGLKASLAKAGYKEPSVTFTLGNAGGSKARAAELVQQFARGHYDMMLTLGTNATIAVASEMRSVPLVFTMVYDPVDAHVAMEWESSGTNATGTSPRIPMANLVGMLKEFRPVKRLAVLYTPGEKNSEVQLKEIQAVQDKYQLKVLPVIVATRDDVRKTVPTVLSSVDAVYLSGSSVIGSVVPEIVRIANGAKVVTVSHLEDHVGKGVLLGLSANPYLLGERAGKKAVKVLKGAKPSSIPIEVLGTYDLLLNETSAAAGQFIVPPAFLKKVKRVVR